MRLSSLPHLVTTLIAASCLLTRGASLDTTLVNTWSLPFSEDAQAGVVAGNRVYLAAGYDGLVIYDVADPHHPVRLGNLASTYAYDVAVSGTIACLADYESGIRVVDINDPTHPVLLGTHATVHDAYGIEVAGAYAYVTMESYGLQVFNISDPANPVSVATYGEGSYMYDFVVRGNLAYVAAYSEGFVILDVSNPANPQELGRWDSDDYVEEVEVDGNYAYLADEGGGLVILDISNPAQPQLAGSLVTEDYAYSVALEGNTAYVAVSYNGMEIIDVTDKANPVRISLLDRENYTYGLFAGNGIAYLMDGLSVTVVDVSDPANPVVETAYNPLAEVEDTAIVGDLLYMACDKSGLQVADISDPAKPVWIGGCPVDATMGRIAVLGSIACLSAEWDGLFIFDISDPANPVQAGHLPARSRVMDMYLRDHYAYVADNGLRIIDLTDPANPTEVGFLASSRAEGVWLAGDTAYVADYDYGVKIIDILNPHAPKLLGTYNPGSATSNVRVRDNLMYVANFSNGLRIVDVSNPASPVLLSTCDTPGAADDLHLAGNLALVADRGQDLQVIDIANPAAPTIVTGYETEGYGYAISANGPFAYLVQPEYGIRIIRVRSSDSAMVVCQPQRVECRTSLGNSPEPAILQVSNSGPLTLAYTVTSDAGWITPAPASGSASTEADPVTLTFSTGSLTPGWHHATITITDPLAANSPYPVPIDLWVEPVATGVMTTMLPGGMEMVPYSNTLEAYGGIAPYTWSPAAGWPAGLANDAAGVVSGKPILEGTYQVDVQVADARGQPASATVILNIQRNPNRPPVVAASDPDAGDFTIGEQTSRTFSVTASDPESVPLSYAWTLDGAPVGTDSSSYQFSTVWGGAGDHVLEVLVSDGLWDSVKVAWNLTITGDNDGDGIPNAFENAHPLLDPWNKDDGAADPDGDHLDNYGEYLAGTLLDNPDCDNDSLPDGWEVLHNLNPLDPAGGLRGMLCEQVARWTLPGKFTGSCYRVLPAPGLVYTAYTGSEIGQTLRIFDVSTPAAPAVRGTYKIAESFSGFFREMVLDGTILYMANDYVGITVFNVANPDIPVRLATIPGEIYGLIKHGNYLLVGDFVYGLRVYNMTNPASPVLAGTLAEAGGAWDIVVVGDYLYVARYAAEILVVNISNITAPTLVKSVNIGGHDVAYALAVRGNHLFVANSDAGMAVLDISNPANPVKVTTLNTRDKAFDINIDGHHAYIAGYESAEMQVIDIEDPAHPVQVGAFSVGQGTYVWSAQALNGYAYIGALGLYVVRVYSEDTDGDGMLDAWETLHFGNLAQTAGGDHDQDGVWNIGEFRAAFNPVKADSDGDGIRDGDEIRCGTSPLNADDLLDVNEVTFSDLEHFNLVWSSVPGYTYRVEYNTALIGAPWVELATIKATASTSSHTDSVPPEQAGRFYRILVLP